MRADGGDNQVQGRGESEILVIAVSSIDLRLIARGLYFAGHSYGQAFFILTESTGINGRDGNPSPFATVDKK